LKVLVGTDFHGNEAVFERFASKAEDERAEVIVVGGDITHFGSFDEAKQLLSLLVRVEVPVIFVPGNCDPQPIVGMLVDGVKCIHGESATYGDVTFMGAGGSPPTPFKTPFEMSEDKIMETLKRASQNLPNSQWVVLVSHTPPVDTLLDKTFLGRHVGSSSVRKFIEERKPSIALCGHIHEAKGRDQIGSSLLLNPGPARHGNYAEVTFNSEVTIELSFL